MEKEMDFTLPTRPSRCTWSRTADPASSPHPKIPTQPRQKIYPNILATIGCTPLVRLNKIPQSEGIKCEILVKCEYFHPGGSVKDRIALRMMQEAEREGVIKPGFTIIEPTAGNTGIGLAMCCAVKGYKCIFVMPERMSNEKVDILKSLGAEVVRTPNGHGSFSPLGPMAVAQYIQRDTPNSIVLNQWGNKGNPLSHYDTTANEIYEDCDGKVDMIIAGTGTSGTLTGIGRRMKEICPTCKIIGADPEGSVLARPESLNQEGKPWELEGIGYDFSATILDRSVVDEWIKISDKEAFLAAKRLVKEEGIMSGGSSGAAMAAALKAAKNLKEGQRCVVILPDGVRNYLTKHVSDAWMEVRNYQPCLNLLNHWWWDHKVADLNLDPAISIQPTTTCVKALNLLRKLGLEQIAIVTKGGKFEGVATLKLLTSATFAAKLTPESPVTKVMMSKCIKVKNDTTLGLVSRALELDGFAVVVEGDGEDEELIGVITPTDLLQYIASRNCSKNCNRECSRKCNS